ASVSAGEQPSPASPSVPGSALDPPPLPAGETQLSGATPIDQLLQELSVLTQGLRVRRQAKGETWYRIAITPDIEIAIRGIDDPEQLNRLERIADHLREMLLRGDHA